MKPPIARNATRRQPLKTHPRIAIHATRKTTPIKGVTERSARPAMLNATGKPSSLIMGCTPNIRYSGDTFGPNANPVTRGRSIKRRLQSIVSPATRKTTHTKADLARNASAVTRSGIGMRSCSITTGTQSIHSRDTIKKRNARVAIRGIFTKTRPRQIVIAAIRKTTFIEPISERPARNATVRTYGKPFSSTTSEIQSILFSAHTEPRDARVATPAVYIKTRLLPIAMLAIKTMTHIDGDSAQPARPATTRAIGKFGISTMIRALHSCSTEAIREFPVIVVTPHR